MVFKGSSATKDGLGYSEIDMLGSLKVETWLELVILLDFLRANSLFLDKSFSSSAIIWSSFEELLSLGISSYISSPLSSAFSSASLDALTISKSSPIGIPRACLSRFWICSMVSFMELHFLSSMIKLRDPISFFNSVQSASNYVSIDEADSFDVIIKLQGIWCPPLVPPTPRTCRPTCED